jgi:hypothetical protein
MRRLTGLFRILIFSAAVWILWYTHIAIVHAQFGGDSCIKEFDTDGPDGSPCPDCCPNQPIVANIIITPADTSPGYQSPVLQSSDCGSPDCTGIGCGNIQYYVAVQDGSCCVVEGDPCNQGSCCNGLQCLSNNTCGTCISDDESCYYDADCCSGFCEPDTHTCGPPCTPFGEECSVDEDCCSGACYGGYCDTQ